MRGDVEQALQLIQGGSPAALDKALGLLQDTVFSFSMKACGHWQDAEDTAQEVMLRSIPHLSKFESPKALAVWLYRVARNRCISSHRENKVSGTKNVSLDELMPDQSRAARVAEEQSSQPGKRSAVERDRGARPAGGAGTPSPVSGGVSAA